MRPLTDTETKTLFTKLANYTGASLSQLIAPTASASSSDDAAAASAKSSDRNVFRLHESRVYYLPLRLANLATSIARDNLVSMGTCVGKFSKTGKFRLHITALDIIAPHARYKVWIKPNGEMPFLYGGNVLKAHVGKIGSSSSSSTSTTAGGGGDMMPEHSGVVVLSMDGHDTPLGFGVSARSGAEIMKKSTEPTMVVVFRQADVGEYLRDEDTLFAG